MCFTQTGCRENTVLSDKLAPINNVNLDTIPDTLTMYSKTVIDDTTITSLNISTVPVYHGIGTINSIYDPLFGTTNASMYFQIAPINTGYGSSLNSSTGAVVDSAVLVLPYSGFTWGDTTVPSTQTYTVYEVAPGGLNIDSTYYGYNTVPIYRDTPLSAPTTINLSPQLEDSVFVDGANQTPHIRIPLNKTFINQMLNPTLAYATDIPTFQSYYGGLYIESSDTTTTTGRAMPYFRLDGVASPYTCAQVLVYYRNPTSGTSSEQSLPFCFTSGFSAHFNRITHVYSKFVQNLLASTSKSDSVMLLQNQPGLAFDITLPNIQYLPNAVINSAQLIITQVSTGTPADAKYWRPTQLYPLGIDQNGLEYSIADRYPLTSPYTSSFIDGTAKSITVGGITVTQYTLNMPRETQAAILQQRPLHLRINGTQDYPGAYQLYAGGRTNATTRVQFRVVYSKLK